MEKNNKKLIIIIVAAVVVIGLVLGLIFGLKGCNKNAKTEISSSMFVEPEFNEASIAGGDYSKIINLGSCECGTVYYSLDKENWSKEVPSFSAAGEYSLYWYIVGDESHFDFASKDDPECISFTLLSIIKDSDFTAPTYVDGDLFLGECDFGTIYYKLNDGEWVTEVINPSEFGTYTLSWYIDAIDGYYDYASKEEPKTITLKVKSEISLMDFSEPTFDGGVLTLGECEFGTFNYSLDYTNWSTSFTLPTDGGAYTLYWSIKGDENHYDFGPSEALKVEFSVISDILEGMFDAPTYSTSSYYHSGVINCITAGFCEVGTFYYSLNDGTYSKILPVVDKTGSYKLSWYLVGDEYHNDFNGEEDAIEFSFTVDKKFITIEEVSFPQAGSLPYTGEPQSIANPGISYKAGIEFYYSTDRTNWSTTLDAVRTNESSYMVYWYIPGNDTYFGIGSEEDPEMLICSISALNLELYMDILPPCPGLDTEYTGSPIKLLEEPMLFVEEEKVGTFYYSLDGVNWSEEIPTATEVGFYYIFWYLSPGEYYNGIADKVNPISTYVEIYVE